MNDDRNGERCVGEVRDNRLEVGTQQREHFLHQLVVIEQFRRRAVQPAKLVAKLTSGKS